MKRTLNLVAAVVALAFGTSALAASFTSGNIVIYRVGGLANQTSGATLTNTGNIVWLDECKPITPTDVINGSNLTVVQSIMLPTNYFGGYSPLIEDAATTLDGLMSRSQDGRFLVLTGFGATLGQYTNRALTSLDANFQVPRIVGLVDGSAHIDTTTVQTNSLSDGEDIRSAASTDGTNLWFDGDSSGIRYTTRGSSLATQLSSFATNLRQLNIFSNQLYFSTAGAPPIRIGIAGTQPPPTTNGTFLSNLPGFVTDTNSPRAFLLFNLAGQTNTFDTLYFADDGNVGNPPGVYKWSLVAGATNWVQTGSISAFAARGLTGYSEISGGTTNVHLWITTGGSVSGSSALYPYIDSTGFNIDPVNNPDGGGADQYVIYPSGATGPNGYDFRGIAMAPVGGETFPSGPGRISVGPITDVFLNNQFTGGPFTFTKNYSVANPGVGTVTWAVSATNNWVGFSPSSGTLTPGASVTVAVSFNANANSLSPGTNLSSIIFTNTTSGNNGFDVTTRPVLLILSQLGISPADDFLSAGPVNGPFSPSGKVYTLTNGSASSLTWGAKVLSNNWVTLSASSGTIAASNSATVSVSVTNANALALSRGAYVDTVAFTNANANDPGNDTRNVSLLIGGGFTSNNLVIYRAGDGTVALNNQPTPVFLDEFTRSGVLIESIPVSTNNYGCSGTATAEGLMTRSTDKQYLVFVGYGTNKTFGAPAPSSSSTVVPRVIGRVDGNGNVDVSTRLTDFNSGGNPRAAVSTNGVDMWVAGNLSGIRYTQLGNTNSSVVCTNPTANMRALNIYSNRLYASSAIVGSGLRIGTVGTSLPTSDIGAAVNLPGFTTNSLSPYNFVMFHLKVGGTDPFDTLYVADDNGNNAGSAGGGGAIFKWSLFGGNWTSNGFVSVTAVRGLAGDVSIVGATTNVNLFAVGSGNTAGGAGTLSAYTDSTGWNAAPSTNAPQIIATAPANESWRSIALAPEIPVTANLVLTPPAADFNVIDMPSTVTTNSASYVVADVSNSSMTWTATWATTWLSLSTYGGTLAAGGNTNVILSINANATTLANGTYYDTVTYVNKVNGQGNTATSVSLTITGAVTSTFATWQSYYFGCTGCPQAQPNADPYGKGMSNTNQFLAGFNPTNTAAYLHIISITKTNNNADIRVTYLGANGDSSYTDGPTSRTNVLEFTTGTANGSFSTNSVTSTGQTNILNAANGLGTLTNMVDVGGATNKPSRYYRVRVLLP